jgi:hypothetical protein
MSSKLRYGPRFAGTGSAQPSVHHICNLRKGANPFSHGGRLKELALAGSEKAEKALRRRILIQGNSYAASAAANRKRAAPKKHPAIKGLETLRNKLIAVQNMASARGWHPAELKMGLQLLDRIEAHFLSEGKP